jgi:hypothetical protein
MLLTLEGLGGRHEMSRVIRRCAAAALGIVVAGLTAATPSGADLPPLHLDLPAGLACAFELQVDGTGGNRDVRVSSDLHVITAGKGYVLTFTNADTGKTLTLNSNGSVEIDTFNADGTTTVDALGFNVIILFPTDVPAGPSTTLYVGRVVYTVDASGVFRIQTHSGPTTDICAALS